MAYHRAPYENQNDELERRLGDQVGSLKHIAVRIGDEARYQNKMLKDMV